MPGTESSDYTQRLTQLENSGIKRLLPKPRRRVSRAA